MGVVRREGDWRLEKRAEGLYEITYQRDPQMRVITPEYRDPQFGGALDMLPAREVDSYTEAEGLFEEKAHGPSPMGIGGGGDLLFDDSGGEVFGGSESGILSDSGWSSESTIDSKDLDAPPGVVAFALVLTGGIVVYSQGFATNSTVFQVGVLFAIAGLGILGWGGWIYRRHGLSEAVSALFERDSRGQSSSSNTATEEKTPPAPKKLKDTIIFDRAEHHCEWCGDRFDGLQVHHIKPRSEGGPNTKRNLIALCPNCHDKADRGGISQSQLKGKVRRIMAE